jgi:hypothetical protein
VAVHPLRYTYFQIPASSAFPNGRIAPRPVLSLSLAKGPKRVSCYAIIDSGADYCVFPLSFMQSLGLDPLIAPIELTAGVGRRGLPTYFADIVVNMQNAVEFPLYAGFTSGLDHVGRGLLGQIGFFDRFNVGFRLCDKTCYIEIPDPLPVPPAAV